MHLALLVHVFSNKFFVSSHIANHSLVAFYVLPHLLQDPRSISDEEKVIYFTKV